MWVDFHSHFLPDIDDGASSVDVSLSMLSKMHEDGVKTVVATPHFYSSHLTVSEFLERRQAAYELVVREASAQGIQIPEIRLGAEVLMTTDMQDIKDADKLLIEGTRCMLIELPLTYWGPWVISTVKALSNTNRVFPVLAHIERYFGASTVDSVNQILEMDVYTQVNASSFYDPYYKKIIKNLHKKCMIHVVGSDCHNMDSRKPDFDRAKAVIDKYYGESFAEYLSKNAERLLADKYPNADFPPRKSLLFRF